jgi:hypothetical protein
MLKKKLLIVLTMASMCLSSATSAFARRKIVVYASPAVVQPTTAGAASAGLFTSLFPILFNTGLSLLQNQFGNVVLGQNLSLNDIFKALTNNNTSVLTAQTEASETTDNQTKLNDQISRLDKILGTKPPQSNDTVPSADDPLPPPISSPDSPLPATASAESSGGPVAGSARKIGAGPFGPGIVKAGPGIVKGRWITLKSGDKEIRVFVQTNDLPSISASDSLRVVPPKPESGNAPTPKPDDAKK